MLRALRALRLVKLLRLLRGMALLKRWETRLSLDYAMLTMLQGGNPDGVPEAAAPAFSDPNGGADLPAEAS